MRRPPTASFETSDCLTELYNIITVIRTKHQEAMFAAPLSDITLSEYYDQCQTSQAAADDTNFGRRVISSWK